MKSDTEPRPFPLAMASENTTVKVVAIQGGAALALRLAEMGINVGAEITVRQRQGSGIVVMRGETRFALGGGMANRILVCESCS